MSSGLLSSHGHGNGERRKNKLEKKKESATERIPSRVAQLYYKHGLFLSSYPTCAISLAIVAALFCW